MDFCDSTRNYFKILVGEKQKQATPRKLIKKGKATAVNRCFNCERYTPINKKDFLQQ